MITDYVYIYEFLSFLTSFLLGLNTVHIIIASVIAALSAVIMLGLAVFTLIANKRARIFGIFAWIGAVAGIITQWLYLLVCNAFHGYVRSLVYQAFVFYLHWDETGTFPTEYTYLFEGFFNTTTIVLMVASVVLSLAFCVCMILMAVYSGRQLKSTKKGFAAAAMVLSIVYAALHLLGLLTPVFVYPIPVLQLIWTAVYNGLLTLPALLLAVQGIFVMIDNKKKKARLDS